MFLKGHSSPPPLRKITTTSDTGQGHESRAQLYNACCTLYSVITFIVGFSFKIVGQSGLFFAIPRSLFRLFYTLSYDMPTSQSATTVIVCLLICYFHIPFCDCDFTIISRIKSVPMFWVNFIDEVDCYYSHG